MKYGERDNVKQHYFFANMHELYNSTSQRPCKVRVIEKWLRIKWAEGNRPPRTRRNWQTVTVGGSDEGKGRRWNPVRRG